MPVHRVLSVLVPAALLAGLTAMGGCQQTRVEAHGRERRVMAGYAMGTLSANLPQEVSVPQAHAAAEATLLDRGYVIEGSGVTRDAARLRARARVNGREESVVIAARLVPSGVRVSIESGVFGDEAVSRAILDDVLVRLGR